MSEKHLNFWYVFDNHSVKATAQTVAQNLAKLVLFLNCMN